MDNTSFPEPSFVLIIENMAVHTSMQGYDPLYSMGDLSSFFLVDTLKKALSVIRLINFHSQFF